MEISLCFICLKAGGEFERAHDITLVHHDGTLLNPLDILLKLVINDVNISHIDELASCCDSCSVDLQNLAVLERNLQKLKEEILSKLRTSFKTEELLPVKRNRAKTSRLSDKEAFTENCDSNISIVEVPLSDTDIEASNLSHDLTARTRIYRNYIHNTLSPMYPNCTLSRIMSESKVRCLSKHCQLEVTFEMSNLEKSNKFKVITKGTRSNHDQDDPNRVLFELTKSEFVDECICEHCCERFESDSTLNEHIKLQHEDQSVYKCPLCTTISKTFQARNSHFLIKHTSDCPYKCANKDCSLAFKTKYKKNQHERDCVFKVRFSCRQCEKTFVSQRNLSDHIKQIHEKNVRNNFKHECEQCGKRFFKKCNYKSHLLSHETPDGTEEKFKCGQSGCEQTFKRLRTLKSHMDLKHSNMKKDYLCSDCGRCLESYTGYRQHLAKHGAPVYIKRNYPCTECEKSFRSPADLRMHQVVHTKSKEFSCDICNAMFTQKSSLKDHYNVHMKKFNCPVCDKAFGRQRYLDNHVKGCGNSRKDEEIQQDQKHELIVGSPSNHTGSNPGTVILISNEGQQAFMVANTNDSQTITLTQDV